MTRYLLITLLSIAVSSCSASFDLVSNGPVAKPTNFSSILVNVECDLSSRAFFRAFKETFTSEMKKRQIDVIVIEGNRLYSGETLQMKISEYHPDLILHFIQRGSETTNSLYVRKDNNNSSSGNLFLTQSQSAKYMIELWSAKTTQKLWDAYLTAGKQDVKPLLADVKFSDEDGKSLVMKLVEAMKRDGIIDHK